MMKHSLVVIVERPDGTTFEQEVEVYKDETIKSAIGRYKRTLGRDYIICDWYLA